MSFNDLKNIKFDVNRLKSFSWQDVRNFVNEQQVLALNIVIAVGSLLIVSFFMNARIQEYSKVKEDLSALEMKEDPVRQYEKTVKESARAFQAFPEALSEDQMVSFITQMAARHQIVIDEFKPPVTNFNAFYQEMTVSLVCSVSKFQDALFFVNGIETSNLAFKVNSWSVRPKDVPRDRFVDLSSGLVMSIEISSIELTDNAQRKPKKK